jgi:hypothetical protein
MKQYFMELSLSPGARLKPLRDALLREQKSQQAKNLGPTQDYL